MIKGYGIVSALLTPFKENHEVDYESLEKLVIYQQEMGVDGFFVCGNTGQYFLLNEEERRKILEKVIEISKDTVIIAHVGSRDLRTAVSLARHAEDVGADAVGSILPGFSFDASYEYYKILGDATGLPLLTYILQEEDEVDLDFVRELTNIPNFAGVKFTAFDQYQLERIKRMDNGKYVVFSGEDEAFAGAQVMGADGAIGSTYNFMPDVFVQIKKALLSGDIEKSKKLQALANDQIETLKQVGILGCIRQILAIEGVIKEYSRPPMNSVNQEGKEICREVVEILRAFRSLGLQDV